MSSRLPLSGLSLLVLLSMLANACSSGGADRSATSAPTAAPVADGQAVGAAARLSTAAVAPTATAAPAQPRLPLNTGVRAMAQLRITSSPRRMLVRVGGERRGRTPTTLHLPPGRHRIVVGGGAYAASAQTVRLRRRQSEELSFTLRPKAAKLDVRAGSKAVRLRLDGKRASVARLRRGVAPGRHTVSATAKGYNVWKRSVRLGPGTTTMLKPRLKPLPARLIIASRPAGAKIYVDGRLRGVTPRTVYRIPAGTRKVSVYKPGYERAVRRVRFGRGGKITIRKRLERAARPTPRLVGANLPLRHRPLAVMIENHPEARPQSGLDQADIVLEAPAEYGISRFIALFVSKDAPVVGPVRSARGYFVLWAKEFNPLYFHAGGSPGAAALADDIELVRQNALWDSRGFYRSNDRVAPHDLYTSTGALLQVARAKGRNVSNGTWGGLRFKRPGTQLGPRRVSYARLTFNDYYYAEWRWNPGRGVYSRWMQGAPHIERNTGAQVTATAVIVRFHRIERIAGDEKARESVAAYGSGKAYILQDGRMTPATWSKKDYRSPTRYYDASGRSLTFNRGGIWIQVLPTYGDASFG